ncbi:hypothetical protein [Halorussus sp. MSC15.2]|uniref:hypothetical protein n=1 Tax=Halorussus sp. MSC15.2 TaxID=2283638 RepID=UPI0013D87DB3|nr:hypothetical protein [Halorussus sp. MSC15.2]NEU58996.1 hypothetical protein [Halorussus sp. MSC15.2]
MVDLDETDLTDPKKALRAQALVADIDRSDYEDPDVLRLQEEAVELLDELATELQSVESE